MQRSVEGCLTGPRAAHADAALLFGSAGGVLGLVLGLLVSVLVAAGFDSVDPDDDADDSLAAGPRLSVL